MHHIHDHKSSHCNQHEVRKTILKLKPAKLQVKAAEAYEQVWYFCLLSYKYSPNAHQNFMLCLRPYQVFLFSWLGWLYSYILQEKTKSYRIKILIYWNNYSLQFLNSLSKSSFQASLMWMKETEKSHQQIIWSLKPKFQTGHLYNSKTIMVQELCLAGFLL